MNDEKNSSADTGFEACEFGPETGDRCEKCGADNRQQYFRRTDIFSMDGEYWCFACVKKEHSANQSDLAANAAVKPRRHGD